MSRKRKAAPRAKGPRADTEPSDEPISAISPLAKAENRDETAGRRSKLSILRDILRTIHNKGGRAKPTHILYGANLSHDRLKKYLDRLENEGFVRKVGSPSGEGSLFEITKKGVEFLSGYNKMKNFFDAFGISI